MTMLPEDWKKIKLPLGIVVAIAVGAVGAYTWASSNLVFASDFRSYQRNVEIRLLERDKKTLETDVLQLEIKKDAYPQNFDKIDNAILNKKKEHLREVQEDLRQLKRNPDDPRLR